MRAELDTWSTRRSRISPISRILLAALVMVCLGGACRCREPARVCQVGRGRQSPSSNRAPMRPSPRKMLEQTALVCSTGLRKAGKSPFFPLHPHNPRAQGDSGVGGAKREFLSVTVDLTPLAHLRKPTPHRSYQRIRRWFSHGWISAGKPDGYENAPDRI